MVCPLSHLQITYVVQTIIPLLSFPGLCSGSMIPLPVIRGWTYNLTDVLVLPVTGNASVTLTALKDNHVLGDYTVGPNSGYRLLENISTNATINITHGIFLSSHQSVTTIVPIFDFLLYLPEQTTFVTSFTTSNTSAHLDSPDIKQEIITDFIVYSASTNSTLSICSDRPLSSMKNISTNLTQHSKEISGEMSCYQMELNGFEGLVINNVSLASRFDISTNYPVAVLVRHTNWFGPVSQEGVNNLAGVESAGQKTSPDDSWTKLLVVHNEAGSSTRMTFTAMSTGRFVIYRGNSAEELDLSYSDDIHLNVEGNTSVYVASNKSVSVSPESPFQEGAVSAHDCNIVNSGTNTSLSMTVNVAKHDPFGVLNNGMIFAHQGERFLIVCLKESNVSIADMIHVNPIQLKTEAVIDRNLFITSFKAPAKSVYTLLADASNNCYFSGFCVEKAIDMSKLGTDHPSSPVHVLETTVFPQKTVTDTINKTNEHGSETVNAKSFDKEESFLAKSDINTSALSNDEFIVQDIDTFDGSNGTLENRTDSLAAAIRLRNESRFKSDDIDSMLEDTSVPVGDRPDIDGSSEIVQNVSFVTEPTAVLNNTNATTDEIKDNKYANELSANTEPSSGTKRTKIKDGVDPNSKFVAVVSLVESNKKKGFYESVSDDWGSGDGSKKGAKSPPYFHSDIDIGNEFDAVPDGKSLLAIIISLASALAAVVIVIVVFFLVEFFSRRKQIRNTRIRPFVSYY